MSRDTESVFTHHFRAFFTGAFLSLTRLATGFARAKYLALVLGTAGVGFLSQATQLQLLGISVGSLAMAVGIINRIGAIGDDPPRQARLLATAFTSQFVVSVTMLVGAVMFVGPLVDAVFGAQALANSPITSLDVLAIVFAVPLSVVASGFLESIYMGAGRYELFVRASIVATLSGFAATLVLIWVWGLPGAFWSIFATSLLLLTSFLFHLRRVRPIRDLFHFGFDLAEANSLFRFSVAVLVAGVLLPIARLWIGRRVIGTYGINANGLLQVPFAMNAYYAPFLTNALWGRLHPAVTRLGPTPEARRELTASLRLVIVMATTAIVAILLFKDILVPLAYSRAFSPAVSLLPAQLFGDYFYFVAMPFTAYVLGLSRLRVYLAIWVVYAAVAVAASFLLMPQLGLQAVPIGYGISNALGAGVAIVWLISGGGPELRGTLMMVVAGALIVALQSVLAWRGQAVVVQAVIFIVTSTAAAVWLWKSRPSDTIAGTR
jgi:O-antigen/teichoic acid export membrane protein